jgi:uncharacterized membrane protein
MSTNTEKPPWEMPAGQAAQVTDLDEQPVRGQPAEDLLTPRQQAIKRIKAKDDFKIHLIVYLAVNAMLVVIWAFTGAGFFWPIFPIAGWGVAVVINGYVAYRGNIYTEEKIQHEMENLP